jgi:hypothetical protein
MQQADEWLRCVYRRGTGPRARTTATTYSGHGCVQTVPAGGDFVRGDGECTGGSGEDVPCGFRPHAPACLLFSHSMQPLFRACGGLRRRADGLHARVRARSVPSIKSRASLAGPRARVSPGTAPAKCRPPCPLLSHGLCTLLCVGSGAIGVRWRLLVGALRLLPLRCPVPLPAFPAPPPTHPRARARFLRLSPGPGIRLEVPYTCA